jgi:hypothetical protein
MFSWRTEVARAGCRAAPTPPAFKFFPGDNRGGYRDLHGRGRLGPGVLRNKIGVRRTNQAGGAGSSIGDTITNTAVAVLEISTWAMMLSGFAAIGFAGYRRRSASFAV